MTILKKILTSVEESVEWNKIFRIYPVILTVLVSQTTEPISYENGTAHLLAKGVIGMENHVNTGMFYYRWYIKRVPV